MMYELKSRVRYSETDTDAKLSLTGVLNYLQDCSTFHSEDAGAGLAFLEKRRRIWLLSSWQVILLRRPALGEAIAVSTWHYETRGIYGLRNFAIRDAAGDYLVKANSCWFLLDTETGKPTRVTEEDTAVYGNTEPRLPMHYAPRRIDLPAGMAQVKSIPVMRCQIDTNRHVNNAQYVDMAMEAVPEDFEVGEVRAEYKKAAVPGDEILLFSAGTPDGYAASLRSESGEIFANVELKRSEDEKHD